ncbi:hypothetical protein [Pararhizobium gei]|uniref:hypothetical protein n=1 Tax=Pararhizobium gei TaxID=1395951 RepID=UPI0023DB92A8|nr:hypothetical protein [Rhizobium gei]
MRLTATLFFCLLGSSALAQPCERWEASMQEDEGGSRMTASICSQASVSVPEAQHDLFVQCGSKDSLWIRYLPFADESYPPGGNEEYQTKMEFSLDQEMFTLDAHYEGMDGAMVMETNIDKPFVSVLMSQKQFMLSDVNNDKVPVATFTLKGAKEAFEKLIKTCGQ